MDITNAYNLLLEELESWFSATIKNLPNLALSLVILVAFFLFARYTNRLFYQSIKRISNKEALNRLFSNIYYISVISIGILTALSVLKLDRTVTTALSAAGIVGLALSFAFQDIATNFISGIFLAFRSPFQIGDIVQTSDYMGVVEKVDLRISAIRTFQGQLIYIPNKEIFQNPITNFSENGKRRIDLAVGVSYGDDLEKVENVTLEAVKKLDFVISEMGMEVLYNEFGNSSINFTLIFWVNYSNQLIFLKQQSATIKAIKTAFDENDITIPFPIRTLDFGIKGGEKLSEMMLNVQNGNGQNKNLNPPAE